MYKNVYKDVEISIYNNMNNNTLYLSLGQLGPPPPSGRLRLCKAVLPAPPAGIPSQCVGKLSS